MAGAVAATVGMVLPSFIIIYLISVFLDDFLEITWIAGAFRGIRIAVGILIIDVAVKMIKQMKKKLLPCIIMGGSFLAMLLINIFSWKFSSIGIMLVAAVVSLVIFVIQGAPSGEDGERK